MVFPKVANSQELHVSQKDIEPNTFEVSLAIAGAASGGAYEAGVIDFLVEALDCWYAAKAKGKDVPKHNLQVKAIVGTSAGGINSALLSVVLNWGHQPYLKRGKKSIWEEQDQTKGQSGSTISPKSLFHKVWVDAIDIDELLGTSDLEKTKVVPSLLNSEPLYQILNDIVLPYQGWPITENTKAYRGWMAQPMPLNITMTNLTGVPYSLGFDYIGDQPSSQFDMDLHKDYMAFAIHNFPALSEAEAQPIPKEYIPVQTPNQPTGTWQILGNSALATSAFPVGLAPVTLTRSYRDYTYRIRYQNAEGQTEYIAPDALEAVEKYTSINVDGGVMDNNPFDLTRQILYGEQEQEISEGEHANRAILLVEAFPPSDNQPPDSKMLALLMLPLRLQKCCGLSSSKHALNSET